MPRKGVPKFFGRDETLTMLVMAIILLFMALIFVSMGHWGPAKVSLKVATRKLWTKTLKIRDNRVRKILAGEGQVYLVSDRIRAISKKGKFLWEAKGPGESEPVEYSGFGVVAGGSELNVWDPEKGAASVKARLKKPAQALKRGEMPNSLYIFDGTELQLFNLTGEQETWIDSLFEEDTAGFAGITSTKDLTAAGDEGKIFFLDPANGQIKTQLELDGQHRCLFPAGIGESRICIHTSSHKIKEGKCAQDQYIAIYQLLEAKKKKPFLLETWKTPAFPAAASPVLMGESVFTASVDDASRLLIQSRNIASGQLQWTLPLPLPEGFPEKSRVTLDSSEFLMYVMHPGLGMIMIDARNGIELERLTIADDKAPGAPRHYTIYRENEEIFIYDATSGKLSAFKAISNQEKEK
jgi:hypothetical protein